MRGRQIITMLVALSLAAILAACAGATEKIEPSPVPSEPLAGLEGTEWVLDALNGNRPVEGANPTLGFFPEDYLEGNAGCNSYGADYSTSGVSFSLAEMQRTDLDCSVPEAVLQQEAGFFEALADLTTYRATAERLEFSNAMGETILAFRRKLPPPVDPALQGTEWILMELQGNSLLPDSRITLNLDREGFNGIAGCNRYGGEYMAASEGNLEAAEISQTEMACEPQALMAQEQAYVGALRDAVAYRLVGENLELDNRAGETILVFSRQEQWAMDPADLRGTAWQLISLDGDRPLAGSAITLAFHNERRLSGHAGCRDYVATYQADPQGIHLLFLAMIEAGCSMEEAWMAQEGEYTTTLEWATDYRLQEGQLEIRTERGEVLVFEPLPEDGEMAIRGTNWTLIAFVEDTQVEGIEEPLLSLSEPLPESGITVAFDEDTVSGSAGCNTYIATYAVAGPSFSLEAIAATKAACAEPAGVMDQEQRYLDLLRNLTTYSRHASQLWLETGDSRALVFSVGTPGYALADLVGDLGASGSAVEVSSSLVDHGFGLEGQQILVDGMPVSVYEFASVVAADMASSGVSADRYSVTIVRSEGEQEVVTYTDWVVTPHLYKKGQLIVIAGDNSDTLASLEAVLGLPFAGG